MSTTSDSKMKFQYRKTSVTLGILKTKLHENEAKPSKENLWELWLKNEKRVDFWYT